MTQPMNGNGAGEAPTSLQINPIEAAQWALTFLARADFKRHERQAFDVCEALLQAIASGRVVLAPAPEQQQESLPLEPAPPAPALQ